MKSSKEFKNFKQAVAATPDIQDHYQKGLQALGKHSLKIKLSDTNKCEGSVDIDTCTTNKYPQSNRWDYLFSYQGEVYFVEVHSANTSQVRTVLRKLRWLKDWLHQHAPEINKLKAKNAYYWIQSKGFDIPPTSPQYRQISQEGLKPTRELRLPL